MYQWEVARLSDYFAKCCHFSLSKLAAPNLFLSKVIDVPEYVYSPPTLILSFHSKDDLQTPTFFILTRKVKESCNIMSRFSSIISLPYLLVYCYSALLHVTGPGSVWPIMWVWIRYSTGPSSSFLAGVYQTLLSVFYKSSTNSPLVDSPAAPLSTFEYWNQCLLNKEVVSERWRKSLHLVGGGGLSNLLWKCHHWEQLCFDDEAWHGQILHFNADPSDVLSAASLICLSGKEAGILCVLFSVWIQSKQLYKCWYSMLCL